jgi:hypothetical protein
MSDFRAIAGVSATLRTLLHDRMELPMNMTVVPPISIGTRLCHCRQRPKRSSRKQRVSIYFCFR